MTRRISIALLGAGAALVGLVPVVGVFTMVAGTVVLAIALEDDMLDDERDEAPRARARPSCRVRTSDLRWASARGEVDARCGRLPQRRSLVVRRHPL